MDAINNIKLSVISDFDLFIKELNIGRSPNYDMILHKISFIQAYSSLTKIDPIYEYLINN